MGQILEAYITNITSLKDLSLKLSLTTQEIDSDQMTRIFQLRGQLVKVYISDGNILPEVQTEVDNLLVEEKGNKTESQRLRAVLYRYWEQDQNGFDTFALYYADRMERIINQIKDKLD